MSAVAALKRQIAELVAGAPLDAPGLPTGLDALDALLPGRGFPRGRLIEIASTRGSGTTTLLRHLVTTTATAGGWVAWIDATRTLAPRDYAHLAPADSLSQERSGGLWVIRPRDAARAAWCADVVLRAGTFALVVVDGAPTLSRRIAVRLAQLARESDAVLVIASHGTPATQMAPAVRLRVERRRSDVKRRGRSAADSSTVVVTLEKGGTLQSLEVGRAIGVARRLCSHPEIPDRRGVARERRNARGTPGSSTRSAERALGRAADGAAAPAAQPGAQPGAQPVGQPPVQPAAHTAQPVANPVTHRRSTRCAEPVAFQRQENERLEPFAHRGRRTRVRG